MRLIKIYPIYIMELGLALLGLGGLYVAANQPATGKEPFVGSDTSTRVPGAQASGVATGSLHNTSAPRRSMGTDRFYTNEAARAGRRTDSAKGDKCTGEPFNSLSGEILDDKAFVHNNMVPFFGGRVRGATQHAEASESRLDNLQGAGSQLVRKTEQAPLFKPHKELQYAHGAPNQSEFMMSRVNPSTRMANVKPWDEEKIGPGLDMGYSAESGPGFNSGMGARDRWLPKTVNQLRVDTNPKLTYSLDGLEGPARSEVLEPATAATQGKVEKYLPDTYYDVGPQRWFTTTGLEHAPAARGVEILQDQNRQTTTSQYYGITKDKEASYVRGTHEEPKRAELQPTAVTNASAVGAHAPAEGDYGIRGYDARMNNRATTARPERQGGIYGMVRAAVAPVLDVLRPSRKENVIGNARPNGNVSTTCTEGPIYNPADRLRTTIKETTAGKLDCNHLNVQKQAAHAYLVSEQQPVTVQRDTTNCARTGGAGPGEHAAVTSYDAGYAQRNNNNKICPSRINGGNMQVFNPTENVSIGRRDADRGNNRMWAPQAAPSAIPSQATHGRINAPQYQEHCTTGCDRIDPDLLSAFKSNPYTQSLQSW